MEKLQMDAYIGIGRTLSNILWGVAAIFIIFTIFRVQNHLKRNHHEVYISLGNPIALVARHDPNKGRFWRYVRNKEYVRLNDEKLNDLIRTFNLSYIVFVIACIPFVVFDFLT